MALTATNVAKLYGLHPRKGTIAVGADADLAIWDPHKQVTVSYDMLHDKTGYTPYEGRQLTGWPVTVIEPRAVAVQDGELRVQRGSGGSSSAACRATPARSDGWSLSRSPAQLRRHHPAVTEVTATAGGAAAARSNERLQGILFLCAGAMIFTIQDVIIKWISDEDAVTQILATRSLVAFAPLFILLHLDGGLRGVNGRRLGEAHPRAPDCCSPPTRPTTSPSPPSRWPRPSLSF